MHPAQEQNVQTTVSVSADDANFLPNGSVERQRSDQIKAVGLNLGGVWGSLKISLYIYTYSLYNIDKPKQQYKIF